MMRFLILGLAVLWAFPATAQKLDDTPRTAVITAFPPEWAALVGGVTASTQYKVNGITILMGTMEDKPVVMIQSGVSMVNAAMNTQMLLDRFVVKRIVFSGIAGGINPELDIGDVVVPERWNQYLEVALAREMPTGWQPERTGANGLPNYGMMFPRDIAVGSATEPTMPRRWFMADPALLALARTVAAKVVLAKCLPATGTTPKCMEKAPRMIVSGTGISGSAFADNAKYREYLFTTFHASVLDMESAAVGQVAFANSVPFIAFRSLSDLAGGDAAGNQMFAFMSLASTNSASAVRGFVAALPD